MRWLLLALPFVAAANVDCGGGGGGSGGGVAASGPSFSSGYGAAAATIVVTDGQTALMTLTASHPDPTETLTYSLDGGADESDFSIDSATGVLTLNVSLTYANPTDADADNVYEVRAVVRDSTGASDTQEISAVVAFSVDTLADVVDGDLTAGNRSLREAIDRALDGEAVSFDPALAGGTITLALGQITIAKGLAIDGDVDNDGVPDIAIDGATLDRIFEIDDGSGTANLEVRLSGLTLTNGVTTGVDEDGGAILNRENLLVVECVLQANRTVGDDALGGAIWSGPGDLTIEGSWLLGNSTAGRSSDGGGIANEGGDLTVISSVVANNTTTGSGASGGGLFSEGGSLTVRRSDIDANAAEGRGGGIATSRGSYTIEQSTIRYNETMSSFFSGGGGLHSVTNNSRQRGSIISSTIHGNRSEGDGGGIYVLNNRVRVSNSTITSNQARRSGGGIVCDEYDPDFDSRTELASTIVADNVPSDLDYETFFTGLNPVFSRGGNLVGLGNATASFFPSEQLGSAPRSVLARALLCHAFVRQGLRTRTPRFTHTEGSGSSRDDRSHIQAGKWR